MTAILYQTTCLINGKIYIGVDGKCDPDYLGSGFALKRAIKRYGRANFRRKDLAAFDTKKEALEAERETVTPEFIARRDTYNLVGGGHGPSIIGQETRRKISESHIGKVMSEEARAKMSKSHTGLSRSKESVEKTAASKRGVPRSPETKRKLSEAGKRRRHSAETRAKMSASQKGEKNHFYGKKHTPETRAKMREGQLRVRGYPNE